MNIVPAFLRRRIAHRPNLVKIVDNIGWLFMDKIIRMGVGLLVGVWVARYLGPEQFGLLNFASAFTGLFSVIAGLGLQSIVVRDIVLNPNNKEETLGTAAALQFLGGIVAYGAVLASIFWLRPENQMARMVVAILGATMLFRFNEVAVYWFESQVLSKYTVWIQNSIFVLFAGIKMILVLQNAPLMMFAWAAMGEALIVALLMLVMLRLRGPNFSRLRVTMWRVKGLIAESWPLLLSGISIMIYMKIDQIMLGQMVGDEAVGIYSAALRISEIWYFVPMGIVASVFPAILNAKKQGEEQYYKRLQQLYDLMTWVSMAIALPMTFLSEPLVELLYGAGYNKAGEVLAIHIWASVFVFLGVASSRWFVAEKRPILSLQRTILGAAVNVILNIILIPRFGALGAAWATVIAQMSVGILFDGLQKETHQMFLMKLKTFYPQRVLKMIKGSR